MSTGSVRRDDRPKRRDGAATRQALLTAARVLMSEHGVEGTSTRDVAAAVGVNQALVYRYFGSKEKLFAEAAVGDTVTDDRLMKDTPLVDLPSALLARVLDGSPVAGDRTGVSMFVTAANDDTVRTIIRDRIEANFGTQLAPRLKGPDAPLRAELLAALVTGIALLHRKIGTRALSDTDRATLTAYVDRMVEPLLDNPAASS